MKYIWEQNNLLYISDGELTRLIPLKTWNATDTTNPTITKKVMEQGEVVISPYWGVKQTNQNNSQGI